MNDNNKTRFWVANARENNTFSNSSIFGMKFIFKTGALQIFPHFLVSLLSNQLHLYALLFLPPLPTYSRFAGRNVVLCAGSSGRSCS